jgi:hypothetical protein
MTADTILAVIFGWLLGLLSPAISQRIHGASRKDELRRAILTELDELGYKMALVCHALRSHLDLLTEDHVLWLEGKMARYKGPEDAGGVLFLLSELKKHPLNRRSGNQNPDEWSGTSVGLVEHSLPLLDLHRHEIATFPLAFQTAVLRISSQLQVFNQRIIIARQRADRTLNGSPLNRQANLLDDLTESYKDLADQSRFIADLIDQVPRY